MRPCSKPVSPAYFATVIIKELVSRRNCRLRDRSLVGEKTELSLFGVDAVGGCPQIGIAIAAAKG